MLYRYVCLKKFAGRLIIYYRILQNVIVQVKYRVTRPIQTTFMTRVHDLWKNMRKSAEHNLSQNHKTIVCEKAFLVFRFYLFSLFPYKLCAKVIHQCKRQKTHVHKPILVLNYLKTFSKIVHLIIYIFYNNSFFIITQQ